jgi:hypothetical protein
MIKKQFYFSASHLSAKSSFATLPLRVFASFALFRGKYASRYFERAAQKFIKNPVYNGVRFCYLNFPFSPKPGNEL